MVSRAVMIEVRTAIVKIRTKFTRPQGMVGDKSRLHSLTGAKGEEKGGVPKICPEGLRTLIAFSLCGLSTVCPHRP